VRRLFALAFHRSISDGLRIKGAAVVRDFWNMLLAEQEVPGLFAATEQRSRVLALMEGGHGCGSIKNLGSGLI
jgi:hypothetical protein